MSIDDAIFAAEESMSTEFDRLVTAWADDLFLHGVHLARWIVDYVDLEESLAVGTLAQEQVAHARELLTAGGLDAGAADRRLFDRPVDEWAPSRLAADPIETWPQVIAVGLLLSHATLAMLAEADLDTDPTAEADDEEVAPLAVSAKTAKTGDGSAEAAEIAARIAGIVAEQRLHLLHWQRWITLLAGSPATRDAFVDTLHWAGQLAGDLLGDLPDPTSSIDAERTWLIPARERFRTDLADSLASATLTPWSFDVSAPRQSGQHAELIQPVLTDQLAVRPRYPDPVLEPR